MKKAVLTSLLTLVGVIVGYSQGTVTFQNTPSSFSTSAVQAANGHTDRLVYNTDNTALVGTNWVTQLYYNLGANQSESSLHVIAGDSPTQFRVGPAGAGIWNGGGSKVFPDVAAGVTATLQVRVWDGSLFSSYALASVATGATTGKSVLFNYAPPVAPSTATGMEGLQSFTLVTNVPEPTTIALGVLGAASLFVVRRRK